MIHTGDCVVVMRTLPADSVDAVVTDPPYGLGFMGKAWDTAGQRASIPPSVAVRIEDGRDVGRLGNYPGGKGQAAVRFDAQPFQAWCTEWGTEALRVTKPGGYLLAFGGTRTHHRLVCGLEDAGWIIRDELDWIYASGFPKGRANLKPAHEPIVLARKPGPLRPLNIEETRIPGVVPVTVQGRSEHTYGNGKGFAPEGLQESNPDPAGRWPSNLLLSDPELFDEPNPWVVGSGAVTTSPETGSFERTMTSKGYKGGGFGQRSVADHPEIHGPKVGHGDSGGYSRFFLVPKAGRADREPVLRGQLGRVTDDRRRPGGTTDLQRRRDRDDRAGKEEGVSSPRENSHATVKPTDLMRHLIRLVTPPGGTVLDPFLGSGSTAIAAELEGFPWIGIEKEAEYVRIADARLNGTQRGLGLDVGAPTRRQAKPGRPPGRPTTATNGEAPKGWSGGWGSDEEPAA